MNRNILRLLMMAMSITFVMLVVGCATTKENSGKDDDGIFTLTDIPAFFNGKYVILFAYDDNLNLYGFQSFNNRTGKLVLCRISNGSVSLPIWIGTSFSDIIPARNSGNCNVSIEIYNKGAINTRGTLPDPIVSVSWRSVTFSNGSAAKTWSSGFVKTP